MLYFNVRQANERSDCNVMRSYDRWPLDHRVVLTQSMHSAVLSWQLLLLFAELGGFIRVNVVAVA